MTTTTKGNTAANKVIAALEALEEHISDLERDQTPVQDAMGDTWLETLRAFRDALYRVQLPEKDGAVRLTLRFGKRTFDAAALLSTDELLATCACVNSSPEPAGPVATPTSLRFFAHDFVVACLVRETEIMDGCLNDLGKTHARAALRRVAPEEL